MLPTCDSPRSFLARDPPHFEDRQKCNSRKANVVQLACLEQGDHQQLASFRAKVFPFKVFKLFKLLNP